MQLLMLLKMAVLVVDCDGNKWITGRLIEHCVMKTMWRAYLSTRLVRHRINVENCVMQTQFSDTGYRFHDSNDNEVL